MTVIMKKFVVLKCLTKTKIQILYDHVDQTRFRIVEMGCQMVQHLSTYTVGQTLLVNLTQPDNRPSNLSDRAKVFTRQKSFTYIVWPVE